MTSINRYSTRLWFYEVLSEIYHNYARGLIPVFFVLGSALCVVCVVTRDSDSSLNFVFASSSNRCVIRVHDVDSPRVGVRGKHAFNTDASRHWSRSDKTIFLSSRARASFAGIITRVSQSRLTIFTLTFIGQTARSIYNTRFMRRFDERKARTRFIGHALL